MRTKYGRILTTTQEKAYNTLRRLLEDEEAYCNDHAMADAFRSYFKPDSEFVDKEGRPYLTISV